MACSLVDRAGAVRDQALGPELYLDRNVEHAPYRFEGDDAGLDHGSRERALEGNTSLTAALDATGEAQVIERHEVKERGDHRPLGGIDLDRAFFAILELIDAECAHRRR